jgi:hypothetical protein
LRGFAFFPDKIIDAQSRRNWDKFLIAHIKLLMTILVRKLNILRARIGT